MPATMPDQTVTDTADVLIIGAGPCGLAVAARLREETPSAIFTDEEHQRYHWIKRHSGRMPLVQANNRKMNGVKAEKYNGMHKSPRSQADGCDEACSKPPPKQTSSTPSILVLDSTGDRWMQKWERSFRTLQIPHLRSPMFFHIDPRDRDGLLAFSHETGREKELWEIAGCVGKEQSKHKKKKRLSNAQVSQRIAIDERDRKDYFSPSTKLFLDHCTCTATRYELDRPNQVQQQEVKDIVYSPVAGGSDAEKVFTVETDKGRFQAKAVVLAIGPGNIKNLPWPISEAESAGACHSLDIRDFPARHVKKKINFRQETNVVVVGGGLSSAHVIDMAVKAGVSKVWHFTRGDLKVKHFDIGLTWMGKFKNYEKAVFWSADTDDERLDMINTARNGGSVTPRMLKVMRQHSARKRLSIHTHTEITSKAFDPISKTWRLETSPPIPDLPPIDYIYCATGASSNVADLPLLASMNRDHPIEIRGGFPCITEDLMWKKDVPLFVTGRFGALRLGPGGPNLEGARLGAERISWALEGILNGRREEREEPSQLSFCGLGNRYAGLDR